ncbi:hypothetical protein [Sphingomonas sp.]|jgi:hypothetical protein|uniref:hypothetical protein n=1 Tax=Sphingomonas sp. TaxID=28214 RepID=UPI00356AD847
MAYPYVPPVSTKFLTVMIEDVSTAGQIYVVPGFRGKIKKINSVLNGAIATANAVLTAKIAGTAVTGSTVTIAFSGSAAGDIDTATPTAANYFTDEQAIEIETDGGSDNAVQVVVTLELETI